MEIDRNQNSDSTNGYRQARKASSQKILVDARRLISKRRPQRPNPKPPNYVISKSVLPEVRARVALMRHLIEEQIAIRATSALLLVRLKLQDGTLPREGGATFHHAL